MSSEIKYIGFYDFPHSKEKRICDIAATNKMDYICNSLVKAGFSVHLISPSWLDDRSQCKGFVKQTTLFLNDKKRITFCPTFASKAKWSRKLKIIFSISWLFFWLTFNTRRKEKVLVYHVQWLSLPIRWAKKIKGFDLILEVEEIYSHVWDNKNLLKRWEQKLINAADYFIVVSEVLAEILGNKTKIIIYGDLSLSELKPRIMNTDKINVVYSGSIDFTKGGAFNAVKTAEFLPEKYIIHILGSGNKEAVGILSDNIEIINRKLNREAIIYHGFITGNDFDEIMSNFSIGINPQFNGKYMETAFPSKIIKYLSYNLRVVSPRIKSIDKSMVSNLITFSENDLPESIAKAILQLDLSKDYNSRDLVGYLDLKFVNEINSLFVI